MNRAAADINSPSVEEKSSVSRVKKSHGLYSFRVEGIFSSTSTQEPLTLFVSNHAISPNPINRIFRIVNSCWWFHRKSWIWIVWSCLATTYFSWWFIGSSSSVFVLLSGQQKHPKCPSELQIKCVQPSCGGNGWEFCIVRGEFITSYLTLSSFVIHTTHNLIKSPRPT